MTMNSTILTVTLNPAIDLSAVTDNVTPEHKLRCTGLKRHPGGGGVNVARVLTRCGADCHALFPAGGVLGRLLRRLLEEEQVKGVAVEIQAETRESFTVLEGSSGREFRFVLPGPSLADDEWRACLDHVARFPRPIGYLVASGSLPPGAPLDFYARLCRVARDRGCRLVLDASGPALSAALDEGVYLVKPNLRELRQLTGRALDDEGDWFEAASGLVASGKAQVVALSLGHLGALLVAEGVCLRAPALSVPMASTVGAGDSFLAAIVWRLAAGAGLEEAFRYGIAGGTAALVAAGTSLARKDELERLVDQVDIRVH